MSLSEFVKPFFIALQTYGTNHFFGKKEAVAPFAASPVFLQKIDLQNPERHLQQRDSSCACSDLPNFNYLSTKPRLV